MVIGDVNIQPATRMLLIKLVESRYCFCYPRRRLSQVGRGRVVTPFVCVAVCFFPRTIAQKPM